MPSQWLIRSLQPWDLPLYENFNNPVDSLKNILLGDQHPGSIAFDFHILSKPVHNMSNSSVHLFSGQQSQDDSLHHKLPYLQPTISVCRLGRFVRGCTIFTKPLQKSSPFQRSSLYPPIRIIFPTHQHRKSYGYGNCNPAIATLLCCKYGVMAMAKPHE